MAQTTAPESEATTSRRVERDRCSNRTGLPARRTQANTPSAVNAVPVAGRICVHSAALMSSVTMIALKPMRIETDTAIK